MNLKFEKYLNEQLNLLHSEEEFLFIPLWGLKPGYMHLPWDLVCLVFNFYYWGIWAD